MILGQNPEWMLDAKCLDLSTTPGPNGEPPEVDRLFFPETLGKSSNEPGKRFCNGTDDRKPCPVRTECLGLALENDDRWGIWGGLSERGRREMHRTVARDARHARAAGE